MRRTVIFAAIGILAALPIACGDDTGTEPVSFGINAQHLQAILDNGEEEILTAHLQQITELDVEFVRSNLNWGRVESRPAPPGDLPDVSAYDDLVEALARHKLRWQPTIVGLDTPPWGADPDALPSCGSRSPPAAAAPFARFAGSVAARYGHNGSFWTENPELPFEPVLDYEIWNSPNYGFFWCPRPDPERYAALYAASRARIRAVDPKAAVHVAGLDLFTEADVGLALRPSLTADQFVERMLRALPAGAAGEIDAIGAHLYGSDAGVLVDKLEGFRETLDRAGLAPTPIVVTEAGWPTMGRNGPAPLGEEDRARELGDTTADVASGSCGVTQFSAHTWVTPERNPADAEHWYGMADPLTADPYSVASAYAEAVANAASRVDEGACDE